MFFNLYVKKKFDCLSFFFTYTKKCNNKLKKIKFVMPVNNVDNTVYYYKLTFCFS